MLDDDAEDQFTDGSELLWLLLLSDVLGWEISLFVLSPEEVGLELWLDSDMICMISGSLNP